MTATSHVDAAKATPPLTEFLPQLVYFASFPETQAAPRSTADTTYFSIDRTLLYANFYLDFGPLNLGQTFLFCQALNKELAKVKPLGPKKLVFFSSTDGKRRANAICILCCWGILYNHMTADEAFAPFAPLVAASLPPFHDATPGLCVFKLTVLDCLKGLEKAVAAKFMDVSTFNVQEYQHYEQVEHGDLNWLSPKFIAFAGPHNEFKQTAEGYITLTPDHYIPYFKKHNVTLVVRLNEKLYDESLFLDAGIDHLELYYPDGTNPPDAILNRFLAACEATTGAVAVHCKAGLGRTGTCIGAYLMKHFRFTAKECIGWLRLCRAGSVIGPQQQFMESIEARMWAAGAAAAATSVDTRMHIATLTSTGGGSKHVTVVPVSPCKTKASSFFGTSFFSKPKLSPLRIAVPTITEASAADRAAGPPSPGKASLKASLRIDLAATYAAAYDSDSSNGGSPTHFGGLPVSPKTQGDNLRELKHTWSKSPTNAAGGGSRP
ncbi:Aste57867_21288 [Aphanomyces stellatus]|uniref:protein-tyrosine-phosphatase n=1 Tax=Aphanomyces stellatus TaxID=120398 RepID=A0A485LH69_9STRA|nr:hypothetical protein As57867_021219 [Aphanomyces stellatus]VFT97960.1 Aste57867_21288 [Aphanomyces stellatus]